MAQLSHLFDNNRRWAEAMRAKDQRFFEALAGQQAPEYFWIGCSDSRVPANEIIGLAPGEVFVHRNVANVVSHSDLNCLSALQFSIDVLKVKHVMAVGHLGCGGVRCALHNERHGLVDNWLRHVQDVKQKHETLIVTLEEHERWDALCRLNVIEQVLNLTQTTIVRDAWERGQALSLHGLVYDLKDGLLQELGLTIDGPDSIASQYAQALSRFYSHKVA